MSDHHQMSLTDPSLPLTDGSLLHPPVPPPPPPPLPQRQVRFIPTDPDIVPAPAQDSLSRQVDGSITNSSGSLAQGGTHLTMREYDDQLNSLKKENLNLKLRIYFMEEQQGMLSNTKNSSENVYKVNIDLKVHGEELKKVLRIILLSHLENFIINFPRS